ncbi:MAG: hypothetical protein IKG11_09235 [Atopobiaceae bacterium]|nr:hypothetical protein [Atopobiaceae bacterium]MDO4404075.1 hypothetical protein [Atopobiaceae bacterium]
MSKTTNTRTATASFADAKPSRTAPRKPRWHALGLSQEAQRDPAALTFARLGLLASRW